jgi:ABC-type Fe3+/spermidine/putrescine transport system ATPase subunit
LEDRGKKYLDLTPGPKMSEAVALQDVTKRYGQVTAVDGISLSVRTGEFMSILGPSGSGKTTVQRLIGGFERPDSGAIRIKNERVENLPPYKRDTATVFQTGALFPHKSVFDNVAYGLRVRGVSKPEISRKVKRALEIVRLAGAEDRLPNQISGGQKQRVALARALVVQPALVLFDEPLSALDLSLRIELRTEIKALHSELKFTAVYVTHDQSEAMAMSERIAIMRNGRCEQVDTPQSVFSTPSSEFVFRFIGESSSLPVQVTPQGVTLSGKVVAKPDSAKLTLGDARLCFRPGWLHLAGGAQGCDTQVSGRLKFSEFLGDVHRYHLDVDGSVLVADQRTPLNVPPGEMVQLGWNTREMMVFQ